jgi:RHS repeat-associated protein
MTFTYDGVGNRVTYKLGTATDSYSYPATSNRLGTITLAAGGSRAFSYDAAGNVTLDNRTGGGYGYTYNSAGRLSEFRVNGVLQASYKYDSLGRQAIRTLTSPTPITIHSVFDSEGRRIAEYNEATGGLIREYVWNGWDAIAVIEAGVTYFIRTDHIGRPAYASDDTGAKIWTATYLPFGGVRTTTGIPIEARFPGQWFQSESGLHQNWMRDYDPTTGRYLQADPLGLVDGASVYGYVKQNPGRWVDPKGEFIANAVGAAVGGVSNLGFQFVRNYLIYGDYLTALRCVDIKSVVISAAFGFVGVSPIAAYRTGGVKSAVSVQGIITYSKLEAGFAPIRIGDECECQIPEDRRSLIDDIFGTFQF